MTAAAQAARVVRDVTLSRADRDRINAVLRAAREAHRTGRSRTYWLRRTCETLTEIVDVWDRNEGSETEWPA